MNYKLSDALRTIIPGLFFSFSLLIILHLNGLTKGIITEDFWNLLKSQFSNLLVLLVPIFGHIMGYFINIVASRVEYWGYQTIVNRPSRIVLFKNKNTYYINNKNLIIKCLEKVQSNSGYDNANHDNEWAERAFSHAKQVTFNNEFLKDFQARSIFARNMFFIQIVVSVILLFHLRDNWIFFMIEIVLLIFLGYNWWRTNCVYAKYVFAEYAKKEKIGFSEDTALKNEFVFQVKQIANE